MATTWPAPLVGGAPTGAQLSTRVTARAHIENWILALNSEEPVPALLLRPLDRAPLGLVLYCHAHGNRFESGKDELLLGRPALQNRAYIMEQGRIIHESSAAALRSDAPLQRKLLGI